MALLTERLLNKASKSMSKTDGKKMLKRLTGIPKLEDANKQFELMVYPGRTHSISGGNSRTHLFTLLTNFVEQTLGASAQRVNP